MPRRNRSLARLFRSLSCAVLFIPLAPAGIAQEVVAPATLGELFVKLAQLQQANIFVARQMSETQLRAAALLQALLDGGDLTDPVEIELAETFIANARTIATVMLAPVATQQVAAGNSMRRLVRRNLLLLERVEPVVADDSALAEALDQYAVLQMQTQDLGVALETGWTRYGETVRTAQLAGMLEPGSFDSTARRWTIARPDIELPPLTAGANVAAVGEVADVPVPPTQALAQLPDLAPGDSPHPATGGGDEVTTLANGSVRIGDWMVTETNGIVSAMATNLDPETAPLLASVTIDCRPDGTLQYVMTSDAGYAAYRVYADATDFAVVRADGNIVSGADALAMSDTLRRRFEWLQADPGGDRQLLVAPGDAPDMTAAFSADGYQQARGRVLYACAPWTPDDPLVQASVAVAPGPEAETASAEPQPPVAPLPRPRPANRPIGIM